MPRRPTIAIARQALAPCGNSRGSVAVMVALTITTLLVFMAFVLDAGYLYSEKNRYQNAVEAAAMAGAASLCSRSHEDIELVVREMALTNGLEDTDSALEARVGFYDENDRYTDFTEYKDFIDEDRIPENEYANAVLVVYRTASQALTGMQPKATLSVEAVAFLRRYGLLSLGEESNDGVTFRDFNDEYPEIANGGIHANADVEFNILGGGNPAIDADSVNVSAVGSVSGYASGISGIEPISMKPATANLDELYRQADKIITNADFPTGIGEELTDEEGNIYTRIGYGNPPTFCPYIGDHGGRVYYFESDAVDVQLSNPPDPGTDAEITNLTFVSETGVTWRANTTVKWGGENEKQVIIVAGEDIQFGGTFHSDGHFDAMGVTLWADGDISWRTTPPYTHSSTIRSLRMISHGLIDIQGPGWPAPVGFNLSFAPPCPPQDVRLGRLVTP